MRNLLKKIISPLRIAAFKFALNPNDPLNITNSLFFHAADLIANNKTKGDYLEFGVFTGGSFVYSYKALQLAFQRASTKNQWNSPQDCQERQSQWDTMKFHAFDSFEGLPEIKGIDETSLCFKEGKYACPEERFKDNIRRKGFPLDKLHIVKGWFEDSLKNKTPQDYGIQQAALVHIDSDLYASAKLVLDFITPALTHGSILIFDDWFSYNGSKNLGEPKAFYEWQQNNPNIHCSPYLVEGPRRNSFIISTS